MNYFPLSTTEKKNYIEAIKKGADISYPSVDYLIQHQEPSLYQLSKINTSVVAYRITLVPAFSEKISIRIQYNNDETYSVYLFAGDKSMRRIINKSILGKTIALFDNVRIYDNSKDDSIPIKEFPRLDGDEVIIEYLAKGVYKFARYDDFYDEVDITRLLAACFLLTAQNFMQ